MISNCWCCLYPGKNNLHKNSQTVKKVRPMQKKQHKKSREIKGGGPEVAVVV